MHIQMKQFHFRLIIHAKFVGLKYFMYYYPASSAVVGILINYHVLALVVLLSWLRFFAPSKYTEDDPDEDESEMDEVNRSLKTKRTNKNVREEKNEEKDSSGSRCSSDLEVINNGSSTQFDSEEDCSSTKFGHKDECNETKKSI